MPLREAIRATKSQDHSQVDGQCDGAEAKHAGVPLRRVDVAVHLIAVGPDLTWPGTSVVALPCQSSVQRRELTSATPL
jgi:hypothetical protein